MLQDIRDNSQGVIAKVVIGLIVAIFALFGVESIIGGFIAAPSIAEVNGEEITEQQLTISTQNLAASIGGNLQNFDQGLLEQIALSQLIEEELLRQSAAKNSMRVSEARIDRAILENPQFQLSGVYNADLAMRTITAQQLNVPLYREQLQSRMLLSQLANAYSSTNFVTQAELERIAALQLQSRDFRFVSLTLGTRTLGEAIPDAEIESYYLANQNEFTIEEMISVQYVELNKAAISDEIEIDDTIVQEQYEAERAAFEGSAERRASHILFEVGPALSQEEALAAATAAKLRLDQGEDFGAVALELSSDTVSAEDDGDIGYSDGTAFPEPLEEALLTLEVDEISGPVITEFGVHLVKLTEDAVVEFAPFEEVSQRIIRDLKAERAELIFAQRLETLSNLAFESSDLQPIAAELDLEIQTSELFPRSGGQGLFANPNLVAAAYSQEVLESEFNSEVIELNDAQALVVRALSREPAQVRPLEEVQGEIAVVLRTQLERERATQLGEQLLASLQAGESIDSMLVENELEWVEQSQITRNSAAINTEIIQAVFSMPRPAENGSVYEGVALTNGTYVVVELNSVNSGDLASLPEAQRTAIISSLLTEKGQADFGAYLTTLREEADVTTRIAQDTF